MRRIALISAGGGMALSAIGMAASAFGYLKPIEGALLQEGIDLLSILHSLRMLVPTGLIGDFQVPPSSGAGAASGTHPELHTPVRI